MIATQSVNPTAGSEVRLRSVNLPASPKLMSVDQPFSRDDIIQINEKSPAPQIGRIA